MEKEVNDGNAVLRNTSTLNLSKLELETFHEINNKVNELVTAIGDIELLIQNRKLEDIKILADKNSTIDTVRGFVEKRAKLIKEFSEKYGAGNINIQTGEITPV